MDAAKALQALNRADTLITEINHKFSTVDMDPDTQATLELEFLTLRIQVEIARKELAIYEHSRIAPSSTAAAV